MNKLLIGIIAFGIAYFAYHKRSQAVSNTAEPVDIVSEDLSTLPVQPEVVANSFAASATIPVSATAETDASEFESVQESETADEIDQPKDNIDQTIIGNEKRLASSKSAAEVFELLQKLRIRIKKLDGMSTKATQQNYAKFLGSYQGPVLNRRQESVYNLTLTIAMVEKNSNQISGRFTIDKGKAGSVNGEFKNDFGVQLDGRDGLVINSSDEKNYFQIYKLDNGYIAGTYYEKKSRSFRAYRFILK